MDYLLVLKYLYIKKEAELISPYIIIKIILLEILNNKTTKPVYMISFILIFIEFVLLVF